MPWDGEASQLVKKKVEVPFDHQNILFWGLWDVHGQRACGTRSIGIREIGDAE